MLGYLMSNRKMIYEWDTGKDVETGAAYMNALC